MNTFFASGQKGKEVRADGKGGTLARGFYVKTDSDTFIGPFRTRKKAETANVCQECEDDIATKHDPRDPPLDTEICLCGNCHDGAVESAVMDLEDEIDRIRNS
jgi:hypothetical protein